MFLWRAIVRANAAIDALGSVRAIAILRMFLGPITLWHLRPFLENLRDGIVYSDRFYDPYVSWYPEADPEVYRILLLVAVGASVTFSIGLLSRLSGLYLAGFVAYNLFLSTTHFAHNRAFLLILITATTLLHPGEVLSVDSLLRRLGSRRGPRPVPLWPLWLLRIQVAAVYVASATSKLLDADWWGGRVLQLRAIDNRQLALDNGAPEWIVDVLADATFQVWFSRSAVITEFVIGLGLLNRRTRMFAIWVAIPFHIAIQIGARVQVFSWAALAALVIWVTPRVRDRQLVVPRGHRLGGVVRRLDWFGRFDVKNDDGQRVVLSDHMTTGAPVTTVDGSLAKWTALSRLPATFFVAAPMLGTLRMKASITNRGR